MQALQTFFSNLFYFYPSSDQKQRHYYVMSILLFVWYTSPKKSYVKDMLDFPNITRTTIFLNFFNLIVLNWWHMSAEKIKWSHCKIKYYFICFWTLFMRLKKNSSWSQAAEFQPRSQGLSLPETGNELGWVSHWQLKNTIFRSPLRIS